MSRASLEHHHHELANAPFEEAMVSLLAISGAPGAMIEKILLRMSMLSDDEKQEIVSELPGHLQSYLGMKTSDPARTGDPYSGEARYDRRTTPRSGRRDYDPPQTTLEETSDDDVDTFLLDGTLRETPGLMSSVTVCLSDECSEPCGFIHLDEDRELRTVREAFTDGLIARNEKAAAQGAALFWS
jgi:hypothetical protein